MPPILRPFLTDKLSQRKTPHRVIMPDGSAFRASSREIRSILKAKLGVLKHGPKKSLWVQVFPDKDSIVLKALGMLVCATNPLHRDELVDQWKKCHTGVSAAKKGHTNPEYEACRTAKTQMLNEAKKRGIK